MPLLLSMKRRLQVSSSASKLIVEHTNEHT
ncbi:hypothetical protein EDF77_2680 [Stenotrophomonas maltophilia]|nr:hypothetical protein [Stenotrophomonas chelatiphaga]ROQ40344.1 hypothetical protein EDF77_2680 [Stenotrophomonas maltophilia]